MHKISLAVALFALTAAFAANAKYNPPKDVPYVSAAQRAAVAEVNNLDKDNDGRLSKEEFLSKNKSYTRYAEKNIRRAKKVGIYKNPEQQFAAADKDNDGYVTFKELSDYVAEYQKQDNKRARYY